MNEKSLEELSRELDDKLDGCQQEIDDIRTAPPRLTSQVIGFNVEMIVFFVFILAIAAVIIAVALWSGI